jgi:hypothetical protein
VRSAIQGVSGTTKGARALRDGSHHYDRSPPLDGEMRRSPPLSLQRPVGTTAPTPCRQARQPQPESQSPIGLVAFGGFARGRWY